MSKLLQVECPHCKTLVTWQAQHLFFPFCSARCKDEDLCSWASEDYSIAGESISDSIIEEDDQII